jgi:CBS domain-containing protein
MARGQTEQACVGDLRPRMIPAIPEHLTMAAARKVAALKRVLVLFVERDGRLVGVLDERALAAAADDVGVAASMSAIGLCLHPAMSVWRARELFDWSRVSVLPVTVGAYLVGAVTRADVEQALARSAARSRGRAPRAGGRARARARARLRVAA